MQPDSPYRLIGALGSSQVGSVWSAVDAEGRPLTVAVLDASVALDQQWRDAFAAAANGLAQPQAGGPRVLYTDFAAPSPWVACGADGGPGAEQVFLALGVTYQPVPADFPENGAPAAPAPEPTAEELTTAIDVPVDAETTQPTEKIEVNHLTPVNPWAAPPPPVSPSPVSAPPQQPVSTPPHQISTPPHAVSAPPDLVSGPPYSISGAPHSIPGPQPMSGPPQPMSVPPHVASTIPQSPTAAPTPHSPAYGPLPPDGPSQYPAYYPPASAPPAAPAPARRRRTGVLVAVIVLVVVLLGGGGGVVAWQAAGGDDPTPGPTTAAPTPPAASPLQPGVEPPLLGDWPNWPKFAAGAPVKALNLEGLGFPLTVPANWECTPGGSAQGFAKYNCGTTAGADQVGGEVIVRDCPAPCDEARRTEMRAAEEAWGLRWRNAGQYATVVETLKANNTTRYGLVVVAYWRSVPEGGLDRQLVLRMTGPAAWNDELRRVANAARDSARF